MQCGLHGYWVYIAQFMICMKLNRVNMWLFVLNFAHIYTSFAVYVLLDNFVKGKAWE